MYEEAQRTMGQWCITLRAQRDVALPWRAMAIDPQGNGTFSTGFSREDALTHIADKIGLDPQVALQEFGL